MIKPHPTLLAFVRHESRAMARLVGDITAVDSAFLARRFSAMLATEAARYIATDEANRKQIKASVQLNQRSYFMNLTYYLCVIAQAHNVPLVLPEMGATPKGGWLLAVEQFIIEPTPATFARALQGADAASRDWLGEGLLGVIKVGQ